MGVIVMVPEVMSARLARMNTGSSSRDLGCQPKLTLLGRTGAGAIGASRWTGGRSRGGNYRAAAK